MPRLLLEVIVQSVADACEAAEGGADRLEVVRAIEIGGLTPPLALVRAIAAATPLPLRVMVRASDDFLLRDADRPTLRRAAADFHALGVDGLVIGFADAGVAAVDDVAAVLDAAPGVRATFHRAFDTLRDPAAAIEALRAAGPIDRILTSGGGEGAGMHGERLRRYQEAAAPLVIVAGG